MQELINFCITNSVIISGLLVALLDFIFAMNKKLEGNGILHSIYMFAKNLLENKPALPHL